MVVILSYLVWRRARERERELDREGYVKGKKERELKW